jgi:hypothetical protein
VTNSLSGFVDSTSQNLTEWKKAWQDEAQRLLLALGRAQAEKNLTAENCMLSIFLALNPLHADRMDLLSSGKGEELAGHVAKIMAATGASKVDRKAKVNSMLHFGFDQLDEFSPGNAYVFGKTNRPGFLPRLDEILTAVVEGDGAKKAEHMGVLRANARMCGIEITPLCDFAQGKMGLAKLIAGFVLPVEHEKSAKRAAGFLKRVGPMYLPKTRITPAGPYNVYLDSRYVVATKLSQVQSLKPIARVRSQLLTDVQLWASYQAARQGVMLLS